MTQRTRDSGIVGITATQVEAADGRVYGINKASTVLTKHWREYRQQLRTLNMTEIAFGRAKSGEVFVFSQKTEDGNVPQFLRLSLLPRNLGQADLLLAMLAVQRFA